jgi:methionine-rich copper-binding protein CopC
MDDTDISPGTRRRGGRRRAGLVSVLAAVVIVLAPGVPAWAHNALADATPAKGAVLKKAPAGVKLRFLQKLNPDDTTITVTGADQQAVATSPPAVDSATGSVTFTDPLANGEYTVDYRVTSRDGHKVQGSYRFTVADPTAPTAPPATASAPVTPTDPVTASAPVAQPVAVTTSTTYGPMLTAGLAAIGVVLVVAVFWLVRRRRRTPSS